MNAIAKIRSGDWVEQGWGQVTGDSFRNPLGLVSIKQPKQNRINLQCKVQFVFARLLFIIILSVENYDVATQELKIFLRNLETKLLAF